MFTVKHPAFRRAVTRSVALWTVIAAGLGSALRSQAQVPPPNDSITNAQALVGVSGTVTATNLYATADPSELGVWPFTNQPPQSTIWFVWTAPITTTIDFNTRGSTDPFANPMQTVMAVYTLKGTNVAYSNLVEVAANEIDPSETNANTGTGIPASRVDFQAKLKTTYYIQVDGANYQGTNEQGYIVLNWGPSLVGGTFGFSTTLYNVGSLDDTIPYGNVTPRLGLNYDGNTVNPSLHNPAGQANVRVTVTRSAPAVGRCEVNFALTNSYYVNLYYTNYFWTNIVLDTYASNAPPTKPISVTNINITNIASANLFQDDQDGQFVYLPLYSDLEISLTNGAGSFIQSPIGSLGLNNGYVSTLSPTNPANYPPYLVAGLIPSFFTNYPNMDLGSCTSVTNQSGPPTTNSDGSYTIGTTNVGCLFVFTNAIIPSAIGATKNNPGGVDFAPTNGVLTFDDFQMSQDTYVMINPNLAYSIPGPDDYGYAPDPNYVYQGINPLIIATLSNPVVDPLENPDITPPTIGQAQTMLNVLNLTSDPSPVFTNGGVGAIAVNIERATFRCNKDVGTVILSVQRFPAGVNESTMVHYTIDSAQVADGVGIPDIGVDNYNFWPTVAGSDYATPLVNSNQANWDYTLPTDSTWSGTYGTLTWDANDGNAKQIEIPINHNGAVEFDSDLYVTIFLEPEEISAAAQQTPLPVVVGNLNTANLTINFDNTSSTIVPGGAVDRAYNIDSDQTSEPPDNPVPGADQQVAAVAIQPADGEAVIGGGFNSFDAQPVNYLVRLETNGQPDQSFISAMGSGPNSQVNAVAVDGQGRIVLGGYFTAVDGTNANFIARLNPDGSLDNTFKTGFGFNGTVWALQIDSSGNILVGGDFTSFNTTNCSRLARLLPTGGLDATFQPSSGQPGTGADSTVAAIALDNSGNIILGGSFAQVNGSNWNNVARLLPTGAPDPTFNPGTACDAPVYAVAVQANNQIIIGGAFNTFNAIPTGSIARLTAGGSLDSSFATGSGANDVIFSVVVQPDQNILIGGQFTSFDSTRRMAYARLLNNGWVDTSFMDTSYNQFAGLINSYYNTNAYNPNDYPNPYNYRNAVYAMGLQNDGNIVIGGSFERVGGGSTRTDVHTHLNVARVIGLATPGPENGGIGNDPGNVTLTESTYSADDSANKLYVQIDRVNGSLGPAVVTLGTNTLAPGPGAATDADFGLSGNDVAIYNDLWNGNIYYPAPQWGWRQSDGYWGLNNDPQPVTTYAGAALDLVINDDKSATQNLFASLSLLNLTSSNLLDLGGVQIPSLPALGTPTAPLEIIDDNQPGGTFGFSTTNYVAVNTGGSVQLTVVRTNGTSGTVTLNYKTSNGAVGTPGTNTAVGVSTIGNNNGDYVTTVGTIVFKPYQTSTNITIPIVDHSTAQGVKDFTVTLYGVTGGANNPASLDTNIPPLVPSSAIVTIIDGNFQPGHLEFSSPSYTAVKGGTATITVNRVGGALGTISVEAATSNLTAVSGLNYVGTTATLVWTNQQITPQTFTVQTLDDNIVEGPKTVELSLFNPYIYGSTTNAPTNGLVLAYPSNAVLTINDSDSYGNIGFLAPNFNVPQTAGQALITVVRTGGSVGTVSVNYSTSNPPTNGVVPPMAPAQAGTNYGAVSGVLTFGPGVTAQTFAVPIYVTGTEAPANRVVLLTLSANSANIASQFPETATITILDPQLVINSAGSVDQTTLNGSGFNDYVTSLALQPNGSVLAGGNFTIFDQYQFNQVGRLLPDGSYDFSFLQNQAGANGTVWQVLSQAPLDTETNGSILAVGAFTEFDQVNRGGIARLNLDGSLDESFNPGAGADNTIYSVAVMDLPPQQTNESQTVTYVIGGQFANYNGASINGVARLNDNGTLDTTFNPGYGAGGTNATVRVVAIQGNQVLVGGDFTLFNNVPHHHLVRLNADGSVDTNFAAFNGVAGPSGFSDINDSVRTILVQPDSRILIGGMFTSVSGSNYNYIARLNSDGTLDTNFNGGVGCNAPVLAVALDSQTRILVGGEFTKASGVTRNGITRLNPDGTLDPTINFGAAANGYIDTIVVQTNDEIDVGGGFTTFNNISENNFARLYGGATVGEGEIEFSQQTYGVMDNNSNIVITVERIGGEGTAAESNVYATVVTSDGTAIEGKNYIGITNNLVFPLGETFETVDVPILGSQSVGGNLTVNLALTNVVYAGLGPQPVATLVISNSSTGLGFASGEFRQSADVASGAAAIPVVRTGNPESTVAVTVYTGTNGSATPGLNYIPETNVLVFTPGVLTNYFLVPILNPDNVFSDVSVDLEMTDFSNAVASTPTNASLVIANVYTGPGFITFSSTNYVASEGDGDAYVTLLRTNGYTGPASITLTTSNLTAIPGVNYSNVTITVQWADGDSSPKTVAIPVLQQTNAGADVTVLLTLSNPQGATLSGPSQEILTINNDIPDVSFQNAVNFVNEGAGVINIFVVRYGPTNVSVTNSYATYSPVGASETNGYAVPGVDYVPTSGQLVFGPGVTLQSIPVTILQSTNVNGLITFQVALSNPSPGLQIGVPGTTTVGIISDLTGFDFSTNTYSVGEDSTNVLITVDRINPNTGNLSVNVSTSDGTAVNGVDYVATNETLSFVTGQASASFTVTLLNPGVVDSNKFFNVNLSVPSTASNAYVVAPSNAVVMITNVYTGVSFGSGTMAVSECAGQAVIPVYRTGVTNSSITVQYYTADGSGVAGENYLAANGTLLFAPGQTEQTFTVPVVNNHIIGPNHTVILALTNVSGVGAQLLTPNLSILTIDECNGSDIVPSGTAWVNGTPDNGVIYPNDQVTLSFGLHDVSGGNTTNLVATLLATNGVTNVVSGPQNYGELIEGGPTVSRQFTFTAVGSNGANISATFALMDGPRVLSNVVFGLTLGGQTVSFTNSEALLLPEIGQITRATNAYAPYYGYPSTIDVSGVVGNGSTPALVTKVTATLTNFGHTFPANADIVLESPSSQASVLMSHTGGSTEVSHLTLSFDQSASSYLPTSVGTALTSGTYLPTTNNLVMPALPVVEYPTPGIPSVPPGYPYPADLNDLTGGSANGNWYLWAINEDTGDFGYISNGWILNLTIGSPVESDADLEVAVSSSPSSATLSNALSYFVSVTNYGPANATNVVITDFLPTGASFVSTTLPGAAQANGSVGANIGTLPVGSGLAFNLQVTPTALGYLTNVVIALADQPNPNSNYMVTNINLISQTAADLAVTLTGGPTPTYVLAPITYYIVVSNGGPSTAYGTVATDVLPASTGVTDISPSTGSVVNDNGVITWTIGTLNDNATATMTIVTDPLAAGTGLDSVSVSSSVYDPYKLNNYAAVKTVVDQPQITLSGSSGSYSLNWPANATNYVLQGTTSLPAVNGWTDINESSIPISNGDYNYALPGSSGFHFFRLKSTP